MATQTLPQSPVIPPPVLAHELRVLDPTGDMKIAWDRTKPEEVATAKQAFDTWIKKGYAAYKTTSSGQQGEVIRQFDPQAERITLAPPMVGG